jgi:hypothetical protein
LDRASASSGAPCSGRWRPTRERGQREAAAGTEEKQWRGELTGERWRLDRGALGQPSLSGAALRPSVRAAGGHHPGKPIRAQRMVIEAMTDGAHSPDVFQYENQLQNANSHGKNS